jgi:hypothetical protein
MKVAVSGARFLGVDQAMAVADLVAAATFYRYDYALRITSGMEGKHSAGSLHYSGAGRDYGLRDVPVSDRQPIREEMSDDLGPDFDVVLESDHIHVEWQPKVAL